MQPKVLIINNTNALIGGVERYIERFCQSFDSIEFHGLFLEKGNEEQIKIGFTSVLYSNDLGSIRSRIKVIKPDFVIFNKCDNLNIYKICKNLKLHSIQIVHDHELHCFRGHKYNLKRQNCSRKMSYLKCSLCSLLVERGSIGVKAINPFFKMRRLKVVKKSIEKYIVLSDFMKEKLILNGIERQKIQKIHPFVTPSEQSSSQGSDNVIVYCGQLIRGKGIDYLIKSCSLISNTNWKLHIYGRGNDRERLVNLVKELSLTSYVIFKGFESDLSKIYSKASIFAFPSIWQEPFGLTGLEAMSFNLPIVGFDVGGVREWLREGKNGFVVPLKDTYAMAKRIEQLLNDKELNSRMGLSSSILAQDLFNRENFTRQWGGVIDEKTAC